MRNLTAALILSLFLLTGCAGLPFQKLEKGPETAAASPQAEQAAQTQQSEPVKQVKETEAEFKSSVTQVNYKDIARNPDRFKNERVYFIGQVAQTQEKGNDAVLRVNVTRGEFDTWEDTVWINYTKPEGQDRILDEDVIQIWGTVRGLQTYIAVLGNEVTIPEIDAEYITIGFPAAEQAEEPTGQATEEPLDPAGAAKADSLLFDELYRNYEYSMIDAINAGDFSLVEHMLQPGSSLSKSQKALVKNLYGRGITEELVSYEILDTKYDEAAGTIEMTVYEEVKVYKKQGDSIVKLTWVYTAQQNGEGMFQFSGIREA